MRKIHGILLGIFLGGVLLGGIGTGIAFGEYSTMEYQGQVQIGQDNLVTEDLDFVYTPAESRKLWLSWVDWGTFRAQTMVKQDSSVPKNVIRYEVSYNADRVQPYLMYAEETEESDEATADMAAETMAEAPSDAAEKTEETSAAEGAAAPEKTVIDGRLYLRTRYTGDEFDLFMQVKDRILGDLRQHRIASYGFGDAITSVTVRVNPAMMEYIEDHTRRN